MFIFAITKHQNKTAMNARIDKYSRATLINIMKVSYYLAQIKHGAKAKKALLEEEAIRIFGRLVADVPNSMNHAKQS